MVVAAAVGEMSGRGDWETEGMENKVGEKIEKIRGDRRMVVVYHGQKLGVGEEIDDQRSNQRKGG